MAGSRFTVVGGGSWGTAFAAVLAGNGHEVVLAMRDADRAREMATSRENGRYLPGFRIPAGVEPVALEPAAVLADADVLVLALPSRAFVDVCRQLAPHLPGSTVALSLTKGLEPDSGRRLSTVAADVLGCGLERVAVLSGPNHAEEIVRGTPAATVVASHSMPLAERLQELVATPRLRVYANGDVIGVELCAAAKNVIALATGVSDGLGFGDNAKAALITRGLAEMTRLGLAFGADPRTFAGLAGLGDLVATCCSRHSRNRRAGELLAEGVAPADVEGRIGMVAEGLVTAPALQRVAAERGLELPLTERVCAVLDGEPAATAVSVLMSREPIAEF
jgi:glycerol-3-phosphate dehydrogenase (NAD(P)+)